MARIEFRVALGTSWAQVVALTNVATNLQSVNISGGRQRPLDQYNANTATATFRYPTGYASPNSNFVTGRFVAIDAQTMASPGTWYRLFVGKVSDVEVQYGIPYSGGVGPGDYVTLTVEGMFAEWARMNGQNYSMASGTLATQTATANTQTGLQVLTDSGFGGNSSFPATTISSTWGDWLNRLALTMNGKIIDKGDYILLVNQYYKTSGIYGNFSDVPGDWGFDFFKYDKITFSSFADNYYTQTTVVPDGLAAQTVQTGSAPYRTYQVNTLNSTTGQALDYANYLLNTYGAQATRITSISCLVSDQKSMFPGWGASNLGAQISVKFRGTTFECILEGVTWSATPEQCRATFYVSSGAYNNYLILNNAVYGKLNENRLGY